MNQVEELGDQAAVAAEQADRIEIRERGGDFQNLHKETEKKMQNHINNTLSKVKLLM